MWFIDSILSIYSLKTYPNTENESKVDDIFLLDFDKGIKLLIVPCINNNY